MIAKVVISKEVQKHVPNGPIKLSLKNQEKFVLDVSNCCNCQLILGLISWTAWSSTMAITCIDILVPHHLYMDYLFDMLVPHH